MDIGFIGFGDAGSNIACGLAEETKLELVIYDECPGLEKKCQEMFASNVNYRVVFSIKELLRQVKLIFVLVPCSSEEKLFDDIVLYEHSDNIFIDCCSALPRAKCTIAKKLSNDKRNYIDAAIMETVANKKHKTPINLSGKRSEEIAQLLNGYGMNVSVIGNEPGQASLVKICRSLFMKGLAALLLETDELCQAYEVKQEVFDSIAASWNQNEFHSYSQKLMLAAYKHCIRQSDELSSVISLQEERNLHSYMAQASLDTYKKFTIELRGKVE